MLTDLTDLQSSDEDVQGVELSFDIETRTSDGSELIERQYTFDYAKEWDKWTFVEFLEKRTPNTDQITERNWRKSRHVMWYDGSEPDVEIPPEVTDALERATGADSIVIQTPE